MRPMLVAGFAGFGSFGLTTAAVPLWALSRGVPLHAVGFVNTVTLSATIISQALLPTVLKRARPAWLLAAGLVVLGASAPFYLITSDFMQIAAVAVLRGFGFGVLTVLGISIVAALAAEDRRAAAISLYGISGALPVLAAPSIGVLLTQAGAFPAVCIASSAMAVLAVPAALRAGRTLAVRTQEPPLPAVSPRRGLGAVRAVALPAALVLTGSVAIGGLTAFLPIARPAGLLAAAGLFTINASAMVVKWPLARAGFGARSMLLVPAGLALAAAGLALSAAGLSHGPDPLLFAGLALVGAGYGLLVNMALLAALSRAGPGGGGLASAAWNIGIDAGQAIGAAVTGTLASSGLGVAGTFATLAALLGAVSLTTFARR
jgi:hypothetical protein